MSEDEMLKCLIAFILGWLASRMMGNGFSVGADIREDELEAKHSQCLLCQELGCYETSSGHMSIPEK